MFENLMLVVGILTKILIVVVPLIVCVAYLTYAERKVIASMQLRVGPSVVGPFGLLQPLADALKLMFKEPILPKNSDRVLFMLAPMITFSLAMLGWAVIPVGSEFVIADINVGVLYLLAISSLGVYGVIIAGWASNSKYAFLGAIRSAAQMVSYEVSIGLIIVSVLLVTQSLNLREIVLAQQSMPLYLELLLLPMMVIFFVSILAETNRHPFDLPEAEAELVAGYNVEYSSMGFAMFFLGEYANMILMSAITVILFMGGWLPPFGITFLGFVPGIIWFCLKIMFCLFVFIWVRAALPRYRYDQLMRLGWKVFLPLSLIWVVLIASIVVYTGYKPA
ncbi:NADH:ubiquinone oxidoreductase subunit H [endosymbiont of Acanthamoeba sp. UWC8]|uniref:NADH-quinone oxidoreductase subunit NuoH n=1 Tax=endosymbiont of Acanthamoeba sp. UWC8 TaxID=86106 RepID=UPI0004D18840|nr:NADH-quinone oxidoreductase subunit NuoH [endosymbiont of Acanthamoeba sp. UWC8]AIF80623.1 NADH:ubiquinone oxidoreductase subunit H [endosymbiont of Acanthamoeba sp. UWC8]